MWERFTDDAKLVISAAREEAVRQGSPWVGAEHILLGLCRAPGADGARVLATLGVDRESLATDIERKTEPEATTRSGDAAALSPRARRVIERSLQEARRLEKTKIGTQHILLGLIEEEEGIAAKVLQEHIRKGQLDHVG